MQARIQIADGRLASFSVPVSVFRDGNQVVADCVMLGLASHGKTEHMARRALRNVIEVFIEEVIEMGTLHSVLQERGWHPAPPGPRQKARTTTWIPPKVVSAVVAHAAS